jgi:hypothetical protein
VLDGLGVVAAVGSFRPGSCSLWYLLCVSLLSAAALSHPIPFVLAHRELKINHKVNVAVR